MSLYSTFSHIYQNNKETTYWYKSKYTKAIVIGNNCYCSFAGWAYTAIPWRDEHLYDEGLIILWYEVIIDREGQGTRNRLQAWLKDRGLWHSYEIIPTMDRGLQNLKFKSNSTDGG